MLKFFASRTCDLRKVNVERFGCSKFIIIQTPKSEFQLIKPRGSFMKSPINPLDV